ncbi:hypothetical protein BC332_09018 [Capsicum chinense]|nr:hypothetical protein BC332_09018 [Capsicum chinense]
MLAVLLIQDSDVCAIIYMAFSLDFNLRSHMKTHSQENYHICPYLACGKRYAHEYKLKNHISSTHQKNTPVAPKYTLPVEKPVKTPKSTPATYGSSSSERPYSCPYEGCDKSYIHEYKPNLLLRNMHPGHLPDDNAKNAQSAADNEMDEGSDQDTYAARRGNGRIQKQSRPKPSLKQPPLKVARKGSSSAACQANLSISKKPWLLKEENYNEEDSEETEEERERDDVGEGWRYGENDDDDEETEEDD